MGAAASGPLVCCRPPSRGGGGGAGAAAAGAGKSAVWGFWDIMSDAPESIRGGTMSFVPGVLGGLGVLSGAWQRGTSSQPRQAQQGEVPGSSTGRPHHCHHNRTIDHHPASIQPLQPRTTSTDDRPSRQTNQQTTHTCGPPEACGPVAGVPPQHRHVTPHAAPRGSQQQALHQGRPLRYSRTAVQQYIFAEQYTNFVSSTNSCTSCTTGNQPQLGALAPGPGKKGKNLWLIMNSSAAMLVKRASRGSRPVGVPGFHAHIFTLYQVPGFRITCGQTGHHRDQIFKFSK